MAIQIIESQEKVREIIGYVREYGILVGGGEMDYVPRFPYRPGLGMNTSGESFAELAKDLDDGLFKILVMGKFKNGKSTFINAMLGRLMMAARATVTTAVIAMVEYGEHDDIVQVYRTDSMKPDLISLEQFTKEFALNEEDEQTIEDGGNCDRFADISHVVMQSHADIFKDGVRLIDSPGLEEANARTRTTNEFVPKANAIIFMLTAQALFSAAERKYIAENFAGKNLRNVFFVINRIDNLNADELERTVKPAVRKGLAEVFTGKDGEFDEELYESRVFFTNAYGALCARTGEPYKLKIGSKEYSVDVAIQDTGIQEFECALSSFLNSDERILATFQSTLMGMANVYQEAEVQVQADEAARSLPLEQLEQNLAAAKEVLKGLHSQAENMSRFISRAGDIISKKVYNSLLSYVQTEIPREFAIEVENSDTKFGVSNMLKMAASAITVNLPWKDKKEAAKEQEKLLAPITDKINDYIRMKLEVWQSRIGTEIEPDLRDLEQELGDEMNRFEIGLNQAVEIFSWGNVKSDGAYTASPLQTIFALSHGDISLAIEGAASGGISWSDYLKRTLVQGIINWGVGMLFGSAILLPALVVEAIGFIFSSQRVPKQLLKQMGPLAFTCLRERVQGEEITLHESINRQFSDQSTDLFKKANGLINEAEERQNKILEEKRNDRDVNDKESERQKAVLEALGDRFSQVYKILYGYAPESEELEKYAKNGGKIAR